MRVVGTTPTDKRGGVVQDDSGGWGNRGRGRGVFKWGQDILRRGHWNSDVPENWVAAEREVTISPALRKKKKHRGAHEHQINRT